MNAQFWRKVPISFMSDVLLDVRNLRKEFAFRGARSASSGGDGAVRAVDDVDLDVRRGEVLGLVGESGCGKSTIAWCIAGLHEPTTGVIRFEGEQLAHRRSRSQRRRIQIVFQDPNSSLNPRMTIGQMVREVLQVHRMRPRGAIGSRARELMHLVGLGESTLDAYPRQLSGGQRQRASIARALALEPDLLIADEPISSLDVSVQATVLNLLQELQQQLDLTMVFIAHNLAVVRHISDRVAVMYLGRIVETAFTEELFSTPRHPYTQGLLRSIPRLTPGRLTREAAVEGEVPSASKIPRGCRFHPRCPIAEDICSEIDPPLMPGPDIPNHLAACHFAWPEQRLPPQPRDSKRDATHG
jgi:oligopeptide transport system ATP-binding protein